MDASTRLYARLGEIPEDPNDPESLADLLVCAFGAFERYYVCWKTTGGEYRQDGYDLPSALRDWLYPNDGSTRDFATLQVVFGRGEEYFASDKNGKLEYKEPEPVKVPEPEFSKEKAPLRRARTVSFLRPLADVTNRSDTTAASTVEENKRSSSTSSRRASRPPSLSYTNSRTNSDASLSLYQIDEFSQTRPNSMLKEAEMSVSPSRLDSEALARAWTRDADEVTIKSSPQRASPNRLASSEQSPEPFRVPEGYVLMRKEDLAKAEPTGRQKELPPVLKPLYSDATTQTSPAPSPIRNTLQIDTAAPSLLRSKSYSIIEQDDLSPVYEDYHYENPIFMGGRMMSFFSNPGYQLGDSLSSGYQSYPTMGYEYEYQDEFEDEGIR